LKNEINELASNGKKKARNVCRGIEATKLEIT
jgi:hypothetical protein